MRATAVTATSPTKSTSGLGLSEELQSAAEATGGKYIQPPGQHRIVRPRGSAPKQKAPAEPVAPDAFPRLLPSEHPFADTFCSPVHIISSLVLIIYFPLLIPPALMIPSL